MRGCVTDRTAALSHGHDGAELVIGRQLQRVGRQLLHRETKTHASDASLPLPAICVTALRQRLADADQACPAAGSAWQHTGLVFCSAFGTPFYPRNVNRSWDTRCL